jgi:hypothetical protein
MPNTEQIKLIHVAARAAGLAEGRYRFLLAQYKGRSARPVTSCKQLSRGQIDDFLAICESLGWRHPGKSETFFRDKAAQGPEAGVAGTAQIEAIRSLAGDLGMGAEGIKTFVRRMTKDRTDSLVQLSRREGWQITEALIAMIGRRDGADYKNLADVKAAYFHHEGHGGTNE